MKTPAESTTSNSEISNNFAFPLIINFSTLSKKSNKNSVREETKAF